MTGELRPETPTCDRCGARDISVIPIPGQWLQFWCESCNNSWWEREDGSSRRPPARTRDPEEPTPAA
jgi:hypothetical protein